MTSKLPVLLALSAALSLSGCDRVGESRLNPFNWFGRSEAAPAAVVQTDTGLPGDARVLVAEVTRLEVRQTPGGAIIFAAGLPPTQGWWDAELVPENDGFPVDGVLTYRFALAEPTPGTPAAARVSTPQSRQVTVATHLSSIRLAGVQRIVVTGAGNSRAVSR